MINITKHDPKSTLFAAYRLARMSSAIEKDSVKGKKSEDLEAGLDDQRGFIEAFKDSKDPHVKRMVSRIEKIVSETSRMNEVKMSMLSVGETLRYRHGIAAAMESLKSSGAGWTHNLSVTIKFNNTEDTRYVSQLLDEKFGKFSGTSADNHIFGAELKYQPDPRFEVSFTVPNALYAYKACKEIAEENPGRVEVSVDS